jgi:hypothetical protein
VIKATDSVVTQGVVMFVKSMVRGVSAAVLMVLVAASASAQIFINQPAGVVPTTTQNDVNSQVLNLPGTSLTQMLGQIAVANLNDVGVGPFYSTGAGILLPNSSIIYLGLGSDYTITQRAGAVANAGPPVQPLATATQNVLNTNTANNSPQPALSTVVVGGFQQAVATINTAYFNPLAGTTGALIQEAAGTTQNAVNVMNATVNNGSASVIGNNGVDKNGAPVDGFQQAYVFLNTGGVLENGTTANLTLVQKNLAPNTIVATNSAIANSIAAASSTLDPSILTLHQTSVVGVNQMDFQALTTGSPPLPVTSNINLAGFQLGGLTPTGTGVVGLTATIGNEAIAYTGITTLGGNYNIGSAALGDGTAVVSGVTQNTVFGLNNITGGAGAGLTLSGVALPGTFATVPLLITGAPASPSDGFLQYVDTTTLALSTIYDKDTQNVGGAGLTGVVNVIGARVDNGSASIIGRSTDLTQSFTLNLNSLQVGGVLQGTPGSGVSLTQAVVNLNESTIGGTTPQATYVGYVNLAVANANVGPATLTNVSQSMNQALNTVGAAQGVNFNLNQEASGALNPTNGATLLSLSSNNIQVAAGSSATITGAFQSLRTTVNVASIGSLSGASTINQAASNISIGGSNQLIALPTSNNATISGIQVNTSAINSIK